ncbi:MAG: BON domain-containing protein [Bryobacteraceae bacterium]
MKNTIRNLTLTLAGVILASPALVQASVRDKIAVPQTNLEKSVRHELVMLPYYNIFDDLSFQVNGGHVTLMGEVTRPTLKSSAENVVKHLEGVTGVTNNIEVLPLSAMDNRIRIATYRSIYGFSPLQRYAFGAVPSIHIIVKNGNVTLTGVVANEGDKNMANIRANGVSGVFSVTNELRVENHS